MDEATPAGASRGGASVGWGLFVQFFRREATTRYLGSVTGLAWALVHPIALLAVFHLVFTSIFRATGFAGSSFLVFVAVALWPWLAAQEAIQRAAACVPGCGGLIRKVAFPHEVVYASVAATLALHFAGYVVVLAVLRAIGEPIHLEGLLLAIPLWLVAAIAVAGIALALAALQVFVLLRRLECEEPRRPEGRPTEGCRPEGRPTRTCGPDGRPTRSCRLERRPAKRRAPCGSGFSPTPLAEARG